MPRSPSDFFPALKASIPVMMGYVPLGIVYGFLFTQAGGGAVSAVVASILIYGGAAQYMMIPMLAAGMPVVSVVFAIFVVNLRHVFYGLSLLDRVPSGGWMRWFLAFALTDETYSLITTFPKETPYARITWTAFLNYFWWVLGSLIGAVIGAAATIDLSGLDFVLTSLFAMLACEQWRRRRTSLPLWAALAGYAASRALLPVEHALAASIAFCFAAGLAWALGGAGKRRTGARGGL